MEGVGDIFSDTFKIALYAKRSGTLFVLQTRKISWNVALRLPPLLQPAPRLPMQQLLLETGRAEASASRRARTQATFKTKEGIHNKNIKTPLQSLSQCQMPLIPPPSAAATTLAATASLAPSALNLVAMLAAGRRKEVDEKPTDSSVTNLSSNSGHQQAMDLQLVAQSPLQAQSQYDRVQVNTTTSHKLRHHHEHNYHQQQPQQTIAPVSSSSLNKESPQNTTTQP
ncbi:hypothetical protein EVAR_70665_1 [Eumeta japonica]|uniref:Uncharacterized protein n=1 Tax=Eumeta variegata TaxID=151549 RepID=A0A4C1ZYD1_EUMVA|nr:hypothetical protein EVAR_70665_1 [Eumeta japonica]